MDYLTRIGARWNMVRRIISPIRVTVTASTVLVVAIAGSRE